jgi:hypothetical protein
MEGRVIVKALYVPGDGHNSSKHVVHAKVWGVYTRIVQEMISNWLSRENTSLKADN